MFAPAGPQSEATPADVAIVVRLSPERRRLLVLALIGLHAALLGASALKLGSGVHPQGDVLRYHQIAQAGAGERVEYPPLAVAALRAARPAGLAALALGLVVLTAAADAAIALVLRRIWSAGAAVAYLALAAPLLAYLVQGYDLAVAALALTGLALAARDRENTAGVLLGAAVFLKLWPVMFIVVLWMMGRRRAAAVQAALTALGLGAWTLAAGLRGPLDVVTFRGAKGWHVESTPGVVYALATGAHARFEGGAYRVGTPPAWIGYALLALSGAAIMLIARRARPASDGGIIVGILSALLAGATLLSPQYLAWLLPFAAIAWHHSERRVFATIALAIAATTALLAFTDLTLPDGLPSHLIALSRNLALGAAVVAVLSSARQTHAAASPFPAVLGCPDDQKWSREHPRTEMGPRASAAQPR